MVDLTGFAGDPAFSKIEFELTGSVVEQGSSLSPVLVS